MHPGTPVTNPGRWYMYVYMNNTQGVQGLRTAVMMVPSATNPPGVDLDKVAASISEQNQTSAAPVTVPVSQTRQFGRSLAGVLSGAALCQYHLKWTPQL